MRILRIFMVLQALALPVSAACQGRDLMADIPADDARLLDAQIAETPHASGNLWRATRGDSTIHVVGTYHLADPRHDALMSRVTSLLDDTTRLLVEATPDHEAQLKADMARDPGMIVRQDGPLLEDLLAPADWQKISDQLRNHGFPVFIAQRLRPWYVSTMLGIPACALQPVKAGERGLDHRIMAAAGTRDIPIAALEDYRSAIGIFTAMTPEQELEMIKGALLLQNSPEDELTTMAHAYFNGQAWRYWQYSINRAQASYPDKQALIESQVAMVQGQMMEQRNRNWIPVILESLPDTGTLLVAAGALHLPGDQGLLALLEREGFAVTRLDQ